MIESRQVPCPIEDGARWYLHDSFHGWREESETVDFRADRRSITLYLQDGGPNDADGTVNGIIVNTSGLALPPSEAEFRMPETPIGNVGGTGCFIGLPEATDWNKKGEENKS